MKPKSPTKINTPIKDTGIAHNGMNAARAEPKNKYVTKATSKIANPIASSTSAIDSRINSVSSCSILYSRPFGKLLLSSSKRFAHLSAKSIEFASGNCLITISAFFFPPMKDSLV